MGWLWVSRIREVLFDICSLRRLLVKFTGCGRVFFLGWSRRF